MNLDKEEAEFDALKRFLDPKEVEKVARLREKYDSGDRYSGYGHDLLQAVRRGWRRKARASMLEAFMYLGKSGWSECTYFPGGLHVLIEAAALKGDSAEDIRRWLQRELDASDSTRIERTVERAQKEAATS